MNNNLDFSFYYPKIYYPKCRIYLGAFYLKICILYGPVETRFLFNTLKHWHYWRCMLLGYLNWWWRVTIKSLIFCGRDTLIFNVVINNMSGWTCVNWSAAHRTINVFKALAVYFAIIISSKFYTGCKKSTSQNLGIGSKWSVEHTKIILLLLTIRPRQDVSYTKQSCFASSYWYYYYYYYCSCKRWLN